MAETKAVWGIEIGQAGLKAIRLKYAPASDQVVAVGFDYIQHPKILSQPDAIPEELIREAMQTFLSRNKVEGDLVAIALPGHSALTRFIQLPPVESSKVAQIIEYEAKQQIPFPLEEVIWDYQRFGNQDGSDETSGFMLDAEVGIFAMKRDQVMQNMAPFSEAKVEIELIQIAPLALCNFLCYDQMGFHNPDDVPASNDYTLVLDMGADNTTLMVSNGGKIWVRNVPLGGNHFTRALTKEMKLTFAKAEHLKCNATKSPDPRAVFQAMRPVFNDYAAEIQRSIGFFSSVNRDATISKVIGVGNGFQMAGLQKFLQQNLQKEVERVESFPGLVGDAVLDAPMFRENIATFVVPYGLALQVMNKGKINTTLLPPEIAVAREIRRKKPWAVVTAATLLFGMAISAVGYAGVWSSVSPDKFGTQIEASKSLNSTVTTGRSSYEGAKGSLNSLRSSGVALVEGLKNTTWLEFYKSVLECLPRDVGDDLDETDIQKQNRIMLQSMTSEKLADVSSWYQGLLPAQKEYMLAPDKEAGPSGPGYVFTLTGVHYHHIPEKPDTNVRENYIYHTLLKNLKQWQVKHDNMGTAVDVRRLGITHPTIISSRTETLELLKKDDITRTKPRINVLDDKRPSTGGGFGTGGFGSSPGSGDYNEEDYRPSGSRSFSAGDEGVEVVELQETSFVVQFVWQPKPEKERAETDPLAPAPTGEGDATDAPPAE